MALKNSTSTETCSKCGVKHSRPVGVRCKRTLNISAPTIRETHSSDYEVHSSVVGGGGQASAIRQRSGRTSVAYGIKA